MSRAPQGAWLRRRLGLAVAAVTAATLLLALLLVAQAVNESQRGQLDEALVSEAHEEAREAASLGGGKLDISDRPGPAADDTGHLTKYSAIYDAAGHVVTRTPTLVGHVPELASVRHPPGECFDAFIDREHVRAVLVPIPGHVGAQLLLAAPRFDLDRDAAFLDRTVLVAVPVSALWAALLTTWIVRRLTRGHELIAGVARHVAAGNLSARIDEGAVDEPMVQLVRDLNQMIDRLSALVSSQREFIAHAAHELRAPLTIVYGELSHSLRRPRDAEAYRQAIADALGSARQLKVLAEDLLTLARVDVSGEPYERGDGVVARHLVENAVRTVMGEAAARGVVVTVDGDCRPIAARPSDLERLFRNLLENAVRHSPRGGVVGAALRDQPGAVVVTVSDQGSGIALTERDRIFEPFYRGSHDLADELPGAGLGLAIARKIARAHGGDVTLAEQSVGARFVVRLPA
jgi:two-component system heavy metal sensor histidine kinase CusS